MARAVGEIGAWAVAPARPVGVVARARLLCGGVALLGAVLFFIGTSWDIQWHTYVGRDRTLIPPHLLMLTGVALSGLAATAVLLIETLGAGRGGAAVPATPFAGLLRGPLGAYLAGFGALTAAIAFPLDSYWHALYGIDVEIWAPFHLMILGGMGAAAVGATYLLASAGGLAALGGATALVRPARWGTTIAWATLMAIFTLLLGDALDTEHPRILGVAGVFALNLYPFLAGLLGSWVLVAAATASPGRYTATKVAGVYLVLALVVSVLVVPATDLLLGWEQLTYIDPTNPVLPIIAFQWPLSPFLAALLVDRVARRVRQPDGTLPRTRALLVAAAVCALPLPAFLPLGVLAIADTAGWAGFLPSLALGVVGAVAGTWLGSKTGDMLRGFAQ